MARPARSRRDPATVCDAGAEGASSRDVRDRRRHRYQSPGPARKNLQRSAPSTRPSPQRIGVCGRDLTGRRADANPFAPLPRGGSERGCIRKISSADLADGSPVGRTRRTPKRRLHELPHPHSSRPVEPCTGPVDAGRRRRAGSAGRQRAGLRVRHRQPGPDGPLGQHAARQPRLAGREPRPEDRQHRDRRRRHLQLRQRRRGVQAHRLADRTRRHLQEALRRARQRHRLVRRRVRRRQPQQPCHPQSQLHRQQIQLADQPPLPGPERGNPRRLRVRPRRHR